MIKVRKMDQPTLALADQIYAVMADVYVPSPWTREQVWSDLQQPSTDYVVAEDGGELVGFLAVQWLADELEVLQLAVRRAWQSQGIAKRLLAALPAQTKVFLEVRASNIPARTLYQSCGFVEIGLRKDYYHHPVEDALLMQKEL